MFEDSVGYDEPADWIVEQARQQGAILSRRQVADWHRAGLIAEPKREFYGGAEGSRITYPHGTLRQAIACSILMKHFGSVERVGWELWVRGFPVAERHWREPLREAHEMFRQFFSFATDEGDADEDGPELSDAADELIAKVGEMPPARMGIARRRLRSSGFKELLGIVASAAIGAFKLTEGSSSESADPANLMARLVGVKPAQHKGSLPASPLLTVTGRRVAENLEAMAQFLPLIPSSFSPVAITEAEFASARDDIILLVNSFLSLRQNEARIVPRSTPDLALLRQIFEGLSPKEQAALLLIWLAVRDVPGWRENLDALRQSVFAELRKDK